MDKTLETPLFPVSADPRSASQVLPRDRADLTSLDH